MIHHRLLILGALALSLFSAPAAKQRSPFGITGEITRQPDAAVAKLHFEVPPECVLYAERLHFETADGNELTPAEIPAPVPHLDKATGKEKPVYDQSFNATLKLDAAFTGNLVVKFQGCSNIACFFPEKRTFAAAANGQLAEVIDAPPAVVVDAAPPADLAAALKPFKVAGQQTGYLNSGDLTAFLDTAAHGGTAADPLAKFKKAGIALTLLLIVLGGLGLNLTPCVLPLIPINLAIIGAGAQAKSRGQGFVRGAVYGAGMALVYGALGLVVVLTGSKFGALNSSPWFNVAIAVIFILMALAMFDVVSLDFSRFSSSMNTGGQSKSLLLVAFTLGAVAALLAGACVAPVVISVLLLSTDLYSKGMVIGLGLPFLLGVGMALPWPFAGASMAFLPKPGKWMAKVKYGFGMLIILFALYYGHTAYGLFKSTHASTALAGAPGSAAAKPQADSTAELLRALAQAQAEGKPVFVDFKASWCKNCVAMDETVFNRAEVRKKLSDFIVVEFQAERPNESPAKDVLDKFNVLGLPTYVVLSPAKNN